MRTFLHWILIPAVLMLVLLVWGARFALDNAEQYAQAFSQQFGESANFSIGSVNSDGYSTRPWVEISDLSYNHKQILSIQAEKLYVRPRILRSILRLGFSADIWAKNLNVVWTDQNGHTHQNIFNNVLVNSDGRNHKIQTHLGDANFQARLRIKNYTLTEGSVHINQCHAVSQLSEFFNIRLPQTTRQIYEQLDKCLLWVSYKQDAPIRLVADLGFNLFQLGLLDFHHVSVLAQGYWENQMHWSVPSVHIKFTDQGHDEVINLGIYHHEKSIAIHVPELQPKSMSRMLLDSKVLVNPTHTSIVTTLSPKGQVRNILAQVHLANENHPLRWNVRAELQNMSIKPTHGIPGIENMYGHVYVEPRNGYFYFDSKDVQLHFDVIYEDARDYPHISGFLMWKYLSPILQLDGQALQVDLPNNHQALGSFLLTLGGKQGRQPKPPNLKLAINAPVAYAPEAMKYIPSNIYKDIPEWLRDDNNAGFIEEFTLLADIDIKKELLDQMKLKINASVRDSSILVPPGIKIEGAQGKFNYLDGDLRVALEPISVQLYDEHWTTSTLTFYKNTQGKWRLNSIAEHIVGDILYSKEAFIPLSLELDKLTLPDTIGNNLGGLDFTALSAIVPETSVKSKKAKYKNTEVEALSVSIQFGVEKMVLSDMGFYSDIYEVGAHDSQLIWTQHKDGTHTTSLSGLALFCNIEKIIRAKTCLSAEDHHTGQLYADLIWYDHPLSMDINNIKGSLRVNIINSSLITKGNIAALQVIEALNLSSVLWNPIEAFNLTSSKDAIAFKLLQGKAILQDNVLKVDPGDMLMVSRSGEFHVHGSYDLQEKIVEGSIGLILPISNNLGWVGWILGATPVIGIGMEILRQSFKKDLDKLFTVRYRVHGPIDSIQLDRIQAKTKIVEADKSNTKDTPK